MKILDNIKLSVRILISFGSAAVIIIMLGWLLTSKFKMFSASAQDQLLSVTSRVTEFNTLRIPVLRLETMLSNTQGVLTSRYVWRNLSTVPATLAIYSNEISRSKNELDSLLNTLSTNSTGEIDTKILKLKSMVDDFAASQSTSPVAPGPITKSWLQQKSVALDQAAFQLKDIENKINDLVNEERASIGEAVSINKAVGNRFQNFVWTLVASLVLLIAVGGYVWYVSLTKPLRLLTETTKRIQAGDWGAQVDIHTADEFGVLAKHFNTMSADIGKLAAYIDQVGNPVYAVDKNFVIQFANKAAANLAGKQPSEFVEKKKCYEIFRLPLCQTKQCPVARAWNTHESITGESNCQTNGTSIPVLYQAASVTNKNGEIIRGVEVLTDISNLKTLSQNIEAERTYLSKSVDLLLEKMEKFAQGDLTVSLNSTGDDVIGRLYRGFEQAVTNVRSIIEQLYFTVQSIASSSAQISSSTEELAAGAQEQSSQASEVASAVEEMTRTIIDNARNATKTAEFSRINGTVAVEGGKVVEMTINKIKDIAAVVNKSAETVEHLGISSEEIGEIISVIDDVADQTNLLALNAAIEAARAGEQGRGFAVVADEVRKLAERTTQATKQITTMIKNIQAETSSAVLSMRQGSQEVNEGIKLADQAGESLKKIIDNATKAVDMINQIAAASEEQSATSEEISRSIEAISSVSAESASGIQQIAQAIDEMNRLTENLRNLTMKFKVNSTNVNPITTNISFQANSPTSVNIRKH
ncbi:MAG: methyl-accepting chemotaxis protein [Candidatus Kryptoniota bacterium]